MWPPLPLLPGSCGTRSRKPPAGRGRRPRGCTAPPHADTCPPPANHHNDGKVTPRTHPNWAGGGGLPGPGSRVWNPPAAETWRSVHVRSDRPGGEGCVPPANSRAGVSGCGPEPVHPPGVSYHADGRTFSGRFARLKRSWFDALFWFCSRLSGPGLPEAASFPVLLFPAGLVSAALPSFLLACERSPRLPGGFCWAVRVFLVLDLLQAGPITLFLAWTLAPAFTSSWTERLKPCQEASCRAVLPSCQEKMLERPPECVCVSVCVSVCNLVLSLQSTSLPEQSSDDVTVPHHGSPVQCCLLPLEKRGRWGGISGRRRIQ